MENQGYIENSILGADRIELIRMLYRGAIASVEEARKNLADGEIMLRSKSISKALDFVSELTLSLNHDAPGGLTQQLAELYEYVQQLLLKAHAGKSDAKLAEAIRILQTLLSAWTELKPPVPSPVEDASEPTPRKECANSPYASGGAGSMSRSWEL